MTRAHNLLRGSKEARANLEAVRADQSSTKTQIEMAEYFWLTSPEGMRAASRKELAALARSEETAPYLLEYMAKDRNTEIRANVASNPNTPSSALLMLVTDTSSRVRGGVARNENTPPSALSSLANDEDESVRASLASGKNTPPHVVIALLDDQLRFVRMSAAENIASPEHYDNLIFTLSERGIGKSTLIGLSVDELHEML
jgi:hypothetical protein